MRNKLIKAIIILMTTLTISYGSYSMISKSVEVRKSRLAVLNSDDIDKLTMLYANNNYELIIDELSTKILTKKCAQELKEDSSIRFNEIAPHQDLRDIDYKVTSKITDLNSKNFILILECYEEDLFSQKAITVVKGKFNKDRIDEITNLDIYTEEKDVFEFYD